jgi:hypothetical protein
MSSEKFNSFETKLKNYIKQIEFTNIDFNLDDIFGNPNFLNCFLKNKDLLKLLIRYLTVLHKDDIINDIAEYYKKEIGDDKNGGGVIDEYYFLNGEYSKVDLKKLTENEVNEMLLFNVRKTTDEHFNEIFNTIKDYDIFDYKFPFDENYLNAKSQNYKFNFLKKFYTKPDVKGLTNRSVLKENDSTDFVLSLNPNITKPDTLTYDPEFGDAFILPYNFNNIAFKKSFFYLCSKYLTNTDLNVKNLLNGFLNFESIFYSKNVIPNTEEGNLITYIYFTATNPDTKTNNKIIEYVPNLRYTVDLPGDTTEDKINQLKDYETIRQHFDEFDTKIVFDDKGVYFSTSNYQPDKILEKIQFYIDTSNYDEMLYYIFNSQFLSRSTCLFGYYIYFILTGKIPDKTIKNVYYDIIALTSTFETFKESLAFKQYTFKNQSKYITLNDLLNFVMDNEK